MKTKLLFAICILMCGLTLSSSAQWTTLAHKAPHNCYGGDLLLSDGTVLAKSDDSLGYNFQYNSTNVGNVYDSLSPDGNGSYINGTWGSINPMANTRLWYSSQVLNDGRVYVAGGEYGTGGSSGEVYNPLTGVWTGIPAYGNAGFSDANSEILENGNVVQATNNGGWTNKLIFDHNTDTWSLGNSSNGSTDESAWVKLPDGSILMVNTGTRNAERFIPSTGNWVPDGTTPVQLYDTITGSEECGPGFLLPDGRIFFIGGINTTAYYTPSGDATPGKWTVGPATPKNLCMPDAAGAMMVNGKILCAMEPLMTCCDSKGNPQWTTPTTFWEFDYLGGTNGAFTQVQAPGNPSDSTLGIPTWQAVMLDLPDGNVLLGLLGNSQYYIYTPKTGPLAAGKPIISSYSQCGSLMLTGHLFNGISEGAAYGDDAQMSTNRPIVRLTNGSNVYYARTVNWNSNGVQRGSKADTVYFTLPAGFPTGPTYSLVVIANGNASDPISVSDFTVFTPPVATASASPNPVCSNATLNLTGGPGGMSNYAWTGPNSYSNGGQSPSIADPVPTDAGTYSLTVTDSHGCTSSATTAPVIINTPPSVIVQPINVNAQWGDNISFTSTATGTPTPTVIWQVSTDGETFNNLPGEVTTTLSLSCVTLAMNGYQYRAVFTNDCGTKASNTATLYVTPKIVAGIVSFNPVTPQYSDTVTINVTIPGGYTCGVQAATGANIYIGTQLMGSITFSTSGTNLTGTLYDVVLLEPTPFGTAPTGQMAPGPHTVTAVLIGASSDYSIANPTGTLNIEPEDARVTYTGALIASTVTATSFNAVVTLSATIQDITAVPSDPAYDPFPGDIRNARVTFIDRDNNTTIASNLPIGLVNASDSKTGTVTYNWNVTIAGSSQTFTIGIIVTNYYTRNSSSDNTLITVAQPVVGNFITADGNIMLTNSSGLDAGNAGSQNSFSAHLKFNNGKGDLQGSLSTLFSRTQVDGLHTYEVESNTVNSLAVKVSGANGTATINSDATITDITNHKANVVVDANASLQMNMVDIGANGKLDSAAITIWNKSGGLWFASKWNGIKTVETVLSQGNIQIHTNSSVRMSDATEASATSDNSSLACKIYPNPNNGQFTLDLSSAANSVYRIRVTDIAGREVFNESFTAAEGTNTRNYDFSQLSGGLYLMAVQNDTDYQLIKVLVQNP